MENLLVVEEMKELFEKTSADRKNELAIKSKN